jgi:hypothetical protein
MSACDGKHSSATESSSGRPADNGETVAVMFEDPPRTACWRHHEARVGFEVAYFEKLTDGWLIDGTTAALQDGATWAVTYRVELDSSWRTRTARVVTRSAVGSRHVSVNADRAGHWTVDGLPAPHLDGCLDVDLEGSAMTNAFPVRRLHTGTDERVNVPAAFIRVTSGPVERLDQQYQRLVDNDSRDRCYDYAAPAFDFATRICYDAAGLVIDYPGLAVRAG